MDKLLIELVELREKIDALQSRHDEIREEVYSAMRCLGLQKYQVENISAEVCTEHSRTSIDKDRLFKLYPKAYDDCLTSTVIKPYLRVKSLETKKEERIDITEDNHFSKGTNVDYNDVLKKALSDKVMRYKDLLMAISSVAGITISSARRYVSICKGAGIIETNKGLYSYKGQSDY